jgi:hypothetical protein
LKRIIKTSIDNLIFIVNRLREIIESELLIADYDEKGNQKPPFLQLLECLQIQWLNLMNEQQSQNHSKNYRDQLATILAFLTGNSDSVDGIPLLLRLVTDSKVRLDKYFHLEINNI